MPPEDVQRTRAIDRFKAFLLRRGNPHGHMLLILLATGCAVFLSSKVLHAAGLLSMAVRHPLAVVIGYLVFLMLVGIWVSYHRWKMRRAGTDSTVYVDHGPYVYLDPVPRGPSPTPAAKQEQRRRAAADGGNWGGNWSGGDWGGSGGDGEGVAIVVVIVIAVGVVAALGASMYIVIEAPALFGEVLLDSALLAGLSRRLRSPQSHWTNGVIRRTWLPALALAVCFALIGLALEHLVPTATTVGEAWTKAVK